MAFPAPVHTLITEPSTLPTVTLAPPHGQIVSRSFYVQPLALIPLIINCLIMGATAVYVWKLWQREDKYYVEEDYLTEEYKDREATPTELTAISGVTSQATVFERRPDTPKNQSAAREEARAAVLRSGISRPFAARTMPLDIRDHAWAHVQTKEHCDSNDGRSMQGSRPTASPPALPELPFVAGTALQATDDAASYMSIGTWERATSGSLDASNPSINPNDASVSPFRVTIQENHDGAPSGHTNDDQMLRHSEETRRNAVVISSSEHEVYRQSGIDWKDDGSSVQGSDFTKYGFSDLDRSSYAKRYEDY